MNQYIVEDYSESDSQITSEKFAKRVISIGKQSFTDQDPFYE